MLLACTATTMTSAPVLPAHSSTPSKYLVPHLSVKLKAIAFSHDGDRLPATSSRCHISRSSAASTMRRHSCRWAASRSAVARFFASCRWAASRSLWARFFARCYATPALCVVLCLCCAVAAMERRCLRSLFRFLFSTNEWQDLNTTQARKIKELDRLCNGLSEWVPIHAYQCQTNSN